MREYEVCETIQKKAYNNYIMYEPFIPFKVTKRVVPAVTVFSASTGTAGYLYDMTAGQDVAIGDITVKASKNGFVISSSAGALETNHDYWFRWAASAQQ